VLCPHRLAIPVVDNIGGIFVSIQQARSIEAVEPFVILLADQKQIRKVEGIRLRLRIEGSPDWSIRVDGDFFEADAVLVECLDTLRHRKLRRELDRAVLSAANTFEDIHRKILFDFVEVAAIPIAQFPLLVEECNSPPFTFVIHEFRTLNGPGGLENTLKV